MGTARSNTKRILTSTLTRREVSPEGGDWREAAACIGMDVDTFTYTGKRDIPRLQLIADTVCGRCPVTKQCRDAATVVDRFWGIRGGVMPGAKDGNISRPPLEPNTESESCAQGHVDWIYSPDPKRPNGYRRVCRACDAVNRERAALLFKNMPPEEEERRKARALKAREGTKCKKGHSDWFVTRDNKGGYFRTGCAECRRESVRRHTRNAKMEA